MELLVRQLLPILRDGGTDGVYLALPTPHGREVELHFYRFPPNQEPTLIGRLDWEEAPLWEPPPPGSSAALLRLSAAAGEWLAREMGPAPGGRRLSVLPLSLGGFHLAFALTPGPEPAHPFFPLLLNLHHRITALFSVERLQQLEHPHQLAQAFFEALCRLLMPPAYKTPGQPVWVPFCRRLYAAPASYEYTLALGDTTGQLKACPAEQWQQAMLQEEVENLYRQVREKWELCNRPELLAASRIERLAREIESTRSVMDSLADSQQRQLQELASLKRLAEQLAAPGAASSFEFYRGTDKWSVRFDGKPVKMKNRYTLGLLYIHQLLLNPGKEIHCHQLYLRSGKDLKQAPRAWREIQALLGKKARLDDEQSWLDGIARVERHLGGASVEVAINLLGYLVFLSEQLYRNHTTRANLARLAEYRRRLKTKRLEAEPGQLDDRFYKKDLTLQGALYQETNWETEHRRMYQNVTKAIHRTINTLSSPEAVAFFRQTLSIGVRCAYFPEKAEIAPPNWKLWMD